MKNTPTRPRSRSCGATAAPTIALEDLGWNLHDVVAEGGYSQFELDFHYTNLLEMADRLVFLRILLKEIAKRHGMFITFMPKPTTGDWRSGAHINISLQSVENLRENLFGSEETGWTDASLYAVGGLMAHSEALTAITCPTVNYYNGLVPTVSGFEGDTVTWAPTNITYGYNNRSAQFRLPQSRYCIEYRAADMCMNVYLGLAMTLKAAVKGIVNKIDPGPATNRDLYQITDAEFLEAGIRLLPRNLSFAIQALREAELACEVMGAYAQVLYCLQCRRVEAIPLGRYRLGSPGIPAALLIGELQPAQRTLR